jgi:hypothetical protein
MKVFHHQHHHTFQGLSPTYTITKTMDKMSGDDDGGGGNETGNTIIRYHLQGVCSTKPTYYKYHVEQCNAAM